MNFLSLAELDAHKARTIGVIASARATAPGIRAFMIWHQTSLLRLLLIDIPPPSDNGVVYSDSLIQRVLRLRFGEWPATPPNVVSFGHTPNPDPAFLASVDRLVWFVDPWSEPTQAVGSGEFHCALLARLALDLGLGVRTLGQDGQPVPSPLDGPLGALACQHLAVWQEERRAWTQACRTQGMILNPGLGEPALWCVGGGALDLGDLALSSALTWRLRRLELAYWSASPGVSWPDVFERMIEAEERGCLADLEAELGPGVMREWPQVAAVASAEAGKP